MLTTYKALMVQGTTSDAGKSILVTGLCRVLYRRGVSVAPFKPQNMALNSAVTDSGGEIGRAQYLQAQAACITPHVDMNPVLLKPSTDTQAQIIVLGKATISMDAIGYRDYKRKVMPDILQAFSRLQQRYDTVLIEGAGSPAEINLRENDVANMGFAEAVDTPVIIIADIDKGGVFAHLYGTLALLSPSEQDRVVGFVINRFRGNLGLLQSGLDWLEEKTGKPVLGVLPYLHGLNLEAEDAIDRYQPDHDHNQPILKVIVPILGRISNHTDFDPLRLHPQVDLRFIPRGQPLPPADLIILPGSKSVPSDLEKLRAEHWDSDIYRHWQRGGKVMGICGGYQMLGDAIHDPENLEGDIETCSGLGYFSTKTVLRPEKQLRNVSGTLSLPQHTTVSVQGYEIHMGATEISEEAPIRLDNHMQDGQISTDNRVLGTYLHGIFDQPEACNALLHWAGLSHSSQAVNLDEVREQAIERLADTLEEHLDIERLFQHPALINQ